MKRKRNAPQSESASVRTGNGSEIARPSMGGDSGRKSAVLRTGGNSMADSSRIIHVRVGDWPRGNIVTEPVVTRDWASVGRLFDAFLLRSLQQGKRGRRNQRTRRADRNRTRL